jgi:hypothetical protein
MAIYNDLHSVGSTFVAAADLSAQQFRFMRQTAAFAVNVCAASTDVPVGVLQNKPLAGEAVDLGLIGTTKVVAGAAIAAGAEVMSDAQGRAITATGAGNSVFGRAVSAATAAGQIIELLIPGRQRVLP